MKNILFFVLVIFTFNAFSNEASETFLSERHRYFCGLEGNLKAIETRACAINIQEENSVDGLSDNISKALSHYKDEKLGDQCLRKNRSSWDKIFYKDEAHSNLLPRDQECACALRMNSVKGALCGESSIFNDKEEKKKKIIMERFSDEIESQFKALSVKSQLYSDSKFSCKISKVENCNFEIKSTEEDLSAYKQNFENYTSQANDSIQEKAWVEEAINEFRRELNKTGDINEVLKSQGLMPEKLDRLCLHIADSNKFSKALMTNKYIYERLCLSGDVEGVLKALSESSKNDEDLNKSFEDFLNIGQSEKLENNCEQINLAKKLYCDLESGKLSFVDFLSMDPDYLKKARVIVPNSLSMAVRCVYKKNDDLKYHSFGKVKDYYIKTPGGFIVDMNGPNDNNRNSNDVSLKEPMTASMPKMVRQPASVEMEEAKRREEALRKEQARREEQQRARESEEKRRRAAAEEERMRQSQMESATESIDDTPAAHVERLMSSESIISVPEDLALKQFGDLRDKVEAEKSAGTLTEDKREQYQEVERQYEEMIGRDLNVFTTNVDDVRRDIVVERGTKKYTEVASRATQLSNEIQTLSKKALTAGPRERFRIQGKLKTISSELKRYKKFGYDFNIKVPSIKQILNVGRGESHKQLSSFEAIQNEPALGTTRQVAKDLKVQDYQPESKQANFPGFQLPVADLGPAQDFTKNFTTGPTKLLPEKNYPTPQAPKKQVRSSTPRASKSGTAKVRRAPASRVSSSGGSSGAVSGGGLSLSGGGNSSPASYSNTMTYQVESKSYESQVLNNAQRPETKVIFVEDLKVMRVFKLNDDKVYEIDGEYTEDSFKENYEEFESEVKLDGEQFFRYRVKDMERMLREE